MELSYLVDRRIIWMYPFRASLEIAPLESTFFGSIIEINQNY